MKDSTTVKQRPQVTVQTWLPGRDAPATFDGWADKISVKGKILTISAEDSSGGCLLIQVELPADEY